MTKTIEKPKPDIERMAFTPGVPCKATVERIGDLVVHVLRAAARPVGEHDHLLLADVGNGIDGDVPQCVPAAAQEHQASAMITRKVLFRHQRITALTMVASLRCGGGRRCLILLAGRFQLLQRGCRIGLHFPSQPWQHRKSVRPLTSIL